MKLNLLLILLALALSGTAPVSAQSNGTGIAERFSYKSSNVLIMEDGEWRAVASHVSGYREQE